MPLILFLPQGDKPGLHDTSVSTESGRERKVTGAIDVAPVVDPVKGREVALDVKLVIEYPVKLRTPFPEPD